MSSLCFLEERHTHIQASHADIVVALIDLKWGDHVRMQNKSPDVAN